MAARLLDSLDTEIDEDAEEAWDAEIAAITSQVIARIRYSSYLYRGPQPLSHGPTKELLMSAVNELVVTYLAAWNEGDSKKRREIIAKTWSDSGTYVDAQRHAEGIAAIDSMIQAAQKQFPGYRLRLVSGIETHNGYFRFSWAAGGNPDAPLYIGGTDFATVAQDGRLQSVVGFLDAAPVPAPH